MIPANTGIQQSYLKISPGLHLERLNAEEVTQYLYQCENDSTPRKKDLITGKIEEWKNKEATRDQMAG